MTEEINKLIESKSLGLPVCKAFELVNQLLADTNDAEEFTFALLDEAKEGTPVARRFVEATSIPRIDFLGKANRDQGEDSHLAGPRLALSTIAELLDLDEGLELAFKLAVVDRIMRQHQFGPYSASNALLQSMPMETIMKRFWNKNSGLVDYVEKRENSPLGLFANIMNDLSEYSDRQAGDPDTVRMAYAYARRTAAAGLYIQGVIDRQEYAYQEQFFRRIQTKLALENEQCGSKEFQVSSANDAQQYLQSYEKRLTTDTITKLVTAVVHLAPKEEVVCPKEQGMLIAPDGVFAWLDEMTGSGSFNAPDHQSIERRKTRESTNAFAVSTESVINEPQEAIAYMARFLGKGASELTEDAQFQNFTFKASTINDEQICRDCGIEMQLDRAGNIETIFLYRKENLIQLGIPFHWTREVVRQQYGAPQKTSNKTVIKDSGWETKVPAYDRFDSETRSIYFAYCSDEGPIDHITLMTSAVIAQIGK